MIETCVADAALKLADSLRQHRFWLSDPRHARELERRRALGRQLLAAPAAHNMPSWQALVRTIGYGRRSRASVPVNLAYGYQMAAALAPAGAPSSGQAGATLAGCFNLGAALFDRVCDNPDLGPGALRPVINETVLERLIDRPGTRSDVLRPYEATGSPTVRLLLLSIYAFFEEFERLAGPANAERYAGLMQMLRGAYRAQMSSAGGRADADYAELVVHAHEKTVLTLRIFGQLARLGPEPAAETVGPGDADGLAATLGRLFSLIDDLVDLARDDRAGEANTLLLRAAIGTRPLACHIECAVQDVCEILGALLAAGPPGFDRHAETLLCWVRSWVEPAIVPP